MPDSQLVKSHQKTSSTRRSSLFGLERKYRPLPFKKDAKQPSKCKVTLFGDNASNQEAQPDQDMNEPDRAPSGILQELFDNANSTCYNDQDKTLLTPRNYKVYVDDTPVEYYGLSVAERRRKGLLK